MELHGVNIVMSLYSMGSVFIGVRIGCQILKPKPTTNELGQPMTKTWHFRPNLRISIHLNFNLFLIGTSIDFHKFANKALVFAKISLLLENYLHDKFRKLHINDSLNEGRCSLCDIYGIYRKDVVCQTLPLTWLGGASIAFYWLENFNHFQAESYTGNTSNSLSKCDLESN